MTADMGSCSGPTAANPTSSTGAMQQDLMPLLQKDKLRFWCMSFRANTA